MQATKTIEIARCWSVLRCKEGYIYTYRNGLITSGDHLVTISKLRYSTPNEIFDLFPQIEVIVADYRMIKPYILVVVDVSPPEMNSTIICTFCFLKDDSRYYLHSCVLDDRLGRDDTYPMMDKDRKNLLLISNTGKQMAKIRIQ